jgi:hypothetical protein
MPKIQTGSPPTGLRPNKIKNPRGKRERSAPLKHTITIASQGRYLATVPKPDQIPQKTPGQPLVTRRSMANNPRLSGYRAIKDNSKPVSKEKLRVQCKKNAFFPALPH